MKIASYFLILIFPILVSSQTKVNDIQQELKKNTAIIKKEEKRRTLTFKRTWKSTHQYLLNSKKVRSG